MSRARGDIGVSLSAALARNSRRASSPIGGTTTIRSPGTCSASRLVHSTTRSGQAASVLSTQRAAAPRMCSQLSRTTRADPALSAASTAGANGTPGCSATPSASATACSSRSSGTDTSSMKAPPPGNRGLTRAATTATSRVLPMPPGPSRVTSRCCNAAVATRSTSAERPTKLVHAAGSPQNARGR